MSEMSDRVVKAMKARLDQEPCTVDDVARAMIEAIRDPTTAMVCAGLGRGAVSKTWRAMCDEALK